MSLDIPDGFAQHTIRWSLLGSSKEVSCSYGVSLDDGTNFADLLTGLNTAWSDHMAGGALGADWTMDTGAIEDNTIQLEGPIGAGGSSFATPPPNVSVLLKKVTLDRGRGNKGRMYLPSGYVAEANVDNQGRIDTDPLGDIQDNVNATMGAVLAVDGVNAVVVLHTIGSSLSPTPIEGMIVESLVATQRRRLR